MKHASANNTSVKNTRIKKLTDMKSDFPGWYQDIIFQAELVDSSPTRGSMVIRPYGYAIWENIQKVLDKKIKSMGAQNAYFPLLIPESFLKKEAEHVEGFAPEVAVVTHAGGKKLEEPLVIRPTSETIIYHMFSRWIHSWRDLPLKINQWANVVRWEMRPRAFLRTSEFLWQEGHTAHATRDEANNMALEARAMYKEFMEEYLAIPIFAGTKSESERFAGAEETYCLEAILQDGKALQMGTSHLLSHSFPKSFEISFQSKDGEMKTPYCSSWGVSTRMIGGLIMMHGDQFGLILPPKIAPIQVAIVPIYKKDEDNDKVLKAANKLKSELEAKDVRVICDEDETKTPGAKFFNWERKGVPLRIEIGPKDIEKNHVVVANRIEQDKTKKKSFISIDTVAQEIPKLLNTIQDQLFEKAKSFVEQKVQYKEKLQEFSKILEKENGVFRTGWCGCQECEDKLKPYKGTIRCILDSHDSAIKTKSQVCFACDNKSKFEIIIAKAY